MTAATSVMKFKDDKSLLVLNPDGTFTSEMECSNVDVHSSYTWNFKRHDEGTYEINAKGDGIVFQFHTSKAIQCSCSDDCNCPPGFQPYKPPMEYVGCPLSNGVLTGFPQVDGYNRISWKPDLPMTQVK